MNTDLSPKISLYYYEYTDDSKQWFAGDAATSLLKCVDRSRKCPYRTRVKDAEGNEIPRQAVLECLVDLKKLDKIIEKTFNER